MNCSGSGGVRPKQEGYVPYGGSAVEPLYIPKGEAEISPVAISQVPPLRLLHLLFLLFSLLLWFLITVVRLYVFASSYVFVSSFEVFVFVFSSVVGKKKVTER